MDNFLNSLFFLFLYLFVEAETTILGKPTLCSDKITMKTLINSILRSKRNDVPEITHYEPPQVGSNFLPVTDRLSRNLPVFLQKMGAVFGCNSVANGIQLPDMQNTSIKPWKVALFCSETKNGKFAGSNLVTESVSLKAAFAAWLKNGLVSYKYPGENVEIQNSCHNDLIGANFFLMMSRKTSGVSCAYYIKRKLFSPEKEVYVACYFDIKLSESASYKTREAVFNYDHFVYLRRNLNKKFPGAPILQTCLDDFNEPMLKFINALRGTGRKSVNSEHVSEDTEETLLTGYPQDIGTFVSNKHHGISVSYIKLLLEYEEEVSDENIAEKSLSFWVENSIGKYNYAGENNSIICDESSLVDSVLTNAFLLMTAEVTRSISCQKLMTGRAEDSNLVVTVACAFSISQMLTDGCLAKYCIFDDDSFYRYCDAKVLNQVLPSYNSDSGMRVLRACFMDCGSCYFEDDDENLVDPMDDIDDGPDNLKVYVFEMEPMFSDYETKTFFELVQEQARQLWYSFIYPEEEEELF